MLALAHEMGLDKLGSIAVKGTKIKPNASRHNMSSRQTMMAANPKLSITRAKTSPCIFGCVKLAKVQFWRTENVKSCQKDYELLQL
jgi:hypothetical protein